MMQINLCFVFVFCFLATATGSKFIIHASNLQNSHLRLPFILWFAVYYGITLYQDVHQRAEYMRTGWDSSLNDFGAFDVCFWRLALVCWVTGSRARSQSVHTCNSQRMTLPRSQCDSSRIYSYTVGLFRPLPPQLPRPPSPARKWGLDTFSLP